MCSVMVVSRLCLVRTLGCAAAANARHGVVHGGTSGSDGIVVRSTGAHRGAAAVVDSDRGKIGVDALCSSHDSVTHNLRWCILVPHDAM